MDELHHVTHNTVVLVSDSRLSLCFSFDVVTLVGLHVFEIRSYDIVGLTLLLMTRIQFSDVCNTLRNLIWGNLEICADN